MTGSTTYLVTSCIFHTDDFSVDIAKDFPLESLNGTDPDASKTDQTPVQTHPQTLTE